MVVKCFIVYLLCPFPPISSFLFRSFTSPFPAVKSTKWMLRKDAAALAGSWSHGCRWTELMKGLWHWAVFVLPQHLPHLKENPGTKSLLHVCKYQAVSPNISMTVQSCVKFRITLFCRTKRSILYWWIVSMLLFSGMLHCDWCCFAGLTKHCFTKYLTPVMTAQ